MTNSCNIRASSNNASYNPFLRIKSENLMRTKSFSLFWKFVLLEGERVFRFPYSGFGTTAWKNWSSWLLILFKASLMNFTPIKFAQNDHIGSSVCFVGTVIFLKKLFPKIIIYEIIKLLQFFSLPLKILASYLLNVFRGSLKITGLPKHTFFNRRSNTGLGCFLFSPR